MSGIADLMKAMADAGAPMEAILLAVRAVEDERAKTREYLDEIERRRAGERERKRRQREIAREEAVNVTGQSRDSHRDSPADVTNSPLSLPPNENNSNPPAHTPANTTRARKATRLPVDWAPSPLPSQLAADVAAWPVGAIERELSKFRDWAAAANSRTGVKSDWDATWRNWLRRVIEDGRYSHKSRVSGLRADPLRNALASAYAECEAEARAATGQADYSGAFPSLPAH